MKLSFKLRSLTTLLGIVLLLGVGCIWCFKIVKIDGNSMYPTFSNSEKVIMRKKIFNENSDRFNIVFIKDPYGSDNMVVKRIIGLPGECIYCENGKIFINNEELHDSFKIDYKTENFGPITLEDNQYYVLGDNREESTDSRVFGAIFDNKIVGFYMC